MKDKIPNTLFTECFCFIIIVFPFVDSQDFDTSVISASYPDEGYKIQSLDWFVGKFGNVHHKIFLALQGKSVKLCLKSFVQRDVIYDDIVFMINKNYFASLALPLII